MRLDREAARLIGARTYAGLPCQSGHDGTRYTDRGTCVDCIRLSEKAYKAANRERAREGRNAAKRARNAANPDKARLERQRYKERHSEHAKALARVAEARRRERTAPERDARKQARLAAIEAARVEREAAKAAKAAARAKWNAGARQRLIMRDRAKQAQRRAVMRGARGRATAETMAQIKALQGNRCAYCGTPDDLTLDHIVVGSNFQFLCLFHNISKKNHADADYRAAKGIPPLTPWDVRAGLIRLAMFP